MIHTFKAHDENKNGEVDVEEKMVVEALENDDSNGGVLIQHRLRSGKVEGISL